MNLVKILIVEDEALVAEALSSYLIKSGYATEMVSSGEEAICHTKSSPSDLIIMDIHLAGEKDGIDTAMEIKKRLPIPVIFLTDYDDQETSKRAASAKPSTYLLKPFNERQILVSIQQALYNTSLNLPAKQDDQYEPQEEYYVINDSLFIKKDSAFLKVPLKNILFIEAERAYSHIHTTDKKYMQTSSMNHVHKKITHPSFIQVHRSYVVNLDQVDAIKGNLLIIGESEIPVGDTYKSDVMKRFPLL